MRQTRTSSGHAIFLVVITLLVYAQTITFSFLHFDDTVYIVENDRVHRWAALPSYFVGESSNAFSKSAIQDLYRPLPACWVLLNYKLFGLHSVLWRLSSLVLYTLGVFLLWRVAWRLAGDSFVAFTAALLYALHPLHVEGVAWLSGACVELLLAAFFLGGFLSYLRWRESGNLVWLIGCGLLTLCAMLSKEAGAALPLLIAAHGLIFRSSGEQTDARKPRLVVLIIVMAIVGTIYSWLRISSIHAVVAGHQQHAWAEIFRTAPLLLVSYLKLAVWPVHLAPWYDIHIVDSASVVSFYIPLTFCIAYAALIVWMVMRKPLMGFLLLWWPLALMPAILGVVAFPDFALVQDRFTFVGLAGLCALAASALRLLPGRGFTLFGFPGTGAIAAAGITLLLGILSAIQVNVWRSDLSLYSHAIEVTPRALRPRMLLAVEFTKHKDIGRAIAAYRDLMQLDPKDWSPYYAYGVTLAQAGDRSEAIRMLTRATELGPSMSPPYIALADILSRQGHMDDAIKLLQRGIPVAREPQLLRLQLAGIQAAQQRMLVTH